MEGRKRIWKQGKKERKKENQKEREPDEREEKEVKGVKGRLWVLRSPSTCPTPPEVKGVCKSPQANSLISQSLKKKFSCSKGPMPWLVPRLPQWLYLPLAAGPLRLLLPPPR